MFYSSHASTSGVDQQLHTGDSNNNSRHNSAKDISAAVSTDAKERSSRSAFQRLDELREQPRVKRPSSTSTNGYSLLDEIQHNSIFKPTDGFCPITDCFARFEQSISERQQSAPFNNGSATVSLNKSNVLVRQSADSYNSTSRRLQREETILKEHSSSIRRRISDTDVFQTSAASGSKVIASTTTFLPWTGSCNSAKQDVEQTSSLSRSYRLESSQYGHSSFAASNDNNFNLPLESASTLHHRLTDSRKHRSDYSLQNGYLKQTDAVSVEPSCLDDFLAEVETEFQTFLEMEHSKTATEWKTSFLSVRDKFCKSPTPTSVFGLKMPSATEKPESYAGSTLRMTASTSNRPSIFDEDRSDPSSFKYTSLNHNGSINNGAEIHCNGVVTSGPYCNASRAHSLMKSLSAHDINKMRSRSPNATAAIPATTDSNRESSSDAKNMASFWLNVLSDGSAVRIPSGRRTPIEASPNLDFADLNVTVNETRTLGRKSRFRETEQPACLTPVHSTVGNGRPESPVAEKPKNLSGNTNGFDLSLSKEGSRLQWSKSHNSPSLVASPKLQQPAPSAPLSSLGQAYPVQATRSASADYSGLNEEPTTSKETASTFTNASGFGGLRSGYSRPSTEVSTDPAVLLLSEAEKFLHHASIPVLRFPVISSSTADEQHALNTTLNLQLQQPHSPSPNSSYNNWSPYSVRSETSLEDGSEDLSSLPHPKPKHNIHVDSPAAEFRHGRLGRVSTGSVAERVQLFEKAPSQPTELSLMTIHAKRQSLGSLIINKLHAYDDVRPVRRNSEPACKVTAQEGRPEASASEKPRSSENETKSNSGVVQKSPQPPLADGTISHQRILVNHSTTEEDNTTFTTIRTRNFRIIPQPTVTGASISLEAPLTISVSSESSANSSTDVSPACPSFLGSSISVPDSITGLQSPARQITIRSSPSSVLGLVNREVIPCFYFKYGRPVSPDDTLLILAQVQAAFNKLDNGRASEQDMPAIVRAAELPLYWKKPLFLKCGAQLNGGSVTYADFVAAWNSITTDRHDEASRFVALLSSNPSKDYLIPEDFEILIQDIVDTHPGLLFLKEAKEFHLRYVHTVIARIWFSSSHPWREQMEIKTIRNSKFLKTLRHLQDEDDINQITDYFSYEHFYVIYCKFWELDKNHDLLINMADLARHGDYALSSRILKRIFSGVVHCDHLARLSVRSSEQRQGKMTYLEFAWFLMAEEDKCQPTSIEYWFRCLDRDGDGILSFDELKFFYDEQLSKMAALGMETLPYEDVLCQVLDMVRPEEPNKLRLKDLKRCRMTSYIFDVFFNVDKYLQHEQRDPNVAVFQADIIEQFSNWDRYAAEEYEMLVQEEVAPAETET